MDKRIIGRLAHDLSRRRSSLLQEVAENQEEMRAVIEQQESELEESAQNDRITRVTSRLNERDQQKIREINIALERIHAGVYGKCKRCGREIGTKRLRALPTTTLCIECAAARERKGRTQSVEEPSERLPIRDRGTDEVGEKPRVREDEDQE
jgi:DnaK suppressor protein